jgi:cytochrome bd-type quinol oxidase subunit 1
MDPDPVLLAHLQFAFTVTFHAVFPNVTIRLPVAPHRVFLSSRLALTSISRDCKTAHISLAVFLLESGTATSIWP